MATVGKILRAAREKQGLSIEDVNSRTKVSILFLTAIENEEYDQLPPLSYTVGFIRLFATAVGQDPGAITAQFKRELKIEPEQISAQRDSSDPGEGIDVRNKVRIPAWAIIAVLALIALIAISSYGCFRATPEAADPGAAGLRQQRASALLTERQC